MREGGGGGGGGVGEKVKWKITLGEILYKYYIFPSTLYSDILTF